MNICFIYLPKPYLNQPDAQAPLGLLYVATAAKKSGHQVQVKNYAAVSEDAAIGDLPAADLYGITATSMEILQANRFAARIKAKYPNTKIILGGPGVCASDYINRNHIDYISTGDGEVTIRAIAGNGAPVQGHISGFCKDIATLPWPDRSLLQGHQGGNIFAHNHRYTDGDTAVIISSRGCAFRCAFCSAPMLTRGRAVRMRTPEDVAAEIRHLKKTYNIRQFRFSDDMFTASKQRTLDMCDAIGKEDVFWRISCRVKPLDKEMLTTMIDSGCRELSFGIESFDDNVLKGLNKRTTAADNVHALELAHQAGINARVLFMIRTPFQTPETIEKNIHWFQRVPYTVAACTALIPIPGCDIWANPDKYNIEILDRDLDKYNFYMFGPTGRRPIDPIFKIKNRDIDEFHKESEYFRDWLEENGKVNKG